MLKAVLEGIAFNHRTHVEALREGFTAREVRQLLPVAPTEVRGQAVARCAARLDAWLPPDGCMC